MFLHTCFSIFVIIVCSESFLQVGFFRFVSSYLFAPACWLRRIEPAVAPCHGPGLQPQVDRGLQVDRRFIVVTDRSLLGIACHCDGCANSCAAVMAMGHASHRAPAADEEALECPGDLPEEEERSLRGLGEAGWPAGAGAACRWLGLALRHGVPLMVVVRQ